MRRVIAILGICLLGSLGCKHVGGKCDCGPVPGEAGMYAPPTGVPTSPAPTTVPATPKTMPMGMPLTK